MRRGCVLSLAAATTSCGDRCPEISRINGGWAVASSVDHGAATGTNTGSYPWDDVFIDGYAIWDLTYVPATQEFRLDLDDQPFTAAYAPDSADCDAFTLDFDGTWLSTAGTRHAFSWSGDLNVIGAHWQGSFTFDDTWTDSATGEGGTLSVQGGQLTASSCAGDC